MLLRCLACLKAVALGLLLAVLDPEIKIASALRLTAPCLAEDRASGDLLVCGLMAACLPGLAGWEDILGLEHFAGAGGSCKLLAELKLFAANTLGATG